MRSTHNVLLNWTKSAAVTTVMITGTALMMTACSTVKPPAKEYTQERLDDQIQVPRGNVVALETTAVGVLNYECRPNPVNANAIGWVLVRPEAEMRDRTGKVVGRYVGPPATWTHTDGSSVVGTQITLAPTTGATNIPNQLSTGTPSAAPGAMQGITYIQRIRTKGGQDMSKPCTQTEMGNKLTLPYQADYIFWKAA